jgi:hypothetical protein
VPARRKKRVGHSGLAYLRARSELIAATDYCAICGGELAKYANWLDPAAPQVDYIVPISRGGSHGRENMEIVHRLCNQRKWAKMPGETEGEMAKTFVWLFGCRDYLGTRVRHGCRMCPGALCGGSFGCRADLGTQLVDFGARCMGFDRRMARVVIGCR